MSLSEEEWGIKTKLWDWLLQKLSMNSILMLFMVFSKIKIEKLTENLQKEILLQFWFLEAAVIANQITQF